MHFGLELFLLVRQQVDLDVRIGGAAHVQGGQFFCLNDRHCQAVRIEVVLQLDVRKMRNRGEGRGKERSNALVKLT